MVLLLANHQTYAQSNTIDSLQNLLQSASEEQKPELMLSLMKEHACSNDSTTRQYFQIINSSNYTSSQELVNAFSTLGQMHYCLGHLDSATVYYKKALNLAQSKKLPKECPFIYNKVGFLLQSAGQLDSSIYYFKEGIEVSKQVKDSLHIASMQTGIGICLQHQGKADSAMILYLKALEIAESIDAKDLIISTKLNISTYYYDHQPSRLRISDFEEMLQIARDIGDGRRELSILEWLGYLHSDSANYEQAYKYFNEGLEANKVVKDQYYNLLLLQGLSYMYNLSGDYEKAIETNDQVIEIRKSTGHTLYLPSMYANNTINYVSLGKNQEAVESGLLAIESGKNANQVDLYYKVYEDLAKAYSSLKEFEKAYEAQKEFTRLSKEILDEKKSKQLTELETKYETEKKEAEIASLSQTATIQSLQLERQNLVIMIGGALVLLVGGLVFFTARQKSLKTQQAQMELEQRFLRSQLNPHFISNALVAVQNYLLKNQSETAVTYLSKFAKLMRETLENSRKEFIPLEDELAMLTNFMDVHKMRLNDSFEYEVHMSDQIDPETDTIPPMFVQPFVENAIEHGISQNEANGRIDLYFEKEAEYISIVIKDNGGGYAASNTSTKAHVSLSTTIIRERMDVFNKTLKRKIQLVLADVKGKDGSTLGAQVELKVPFRYL